jgi:hypothetical protein
VYEIFAIAGGVLIGLLAQCLVTTHLKIVTLVLSSVFVGAGASFISGEWQASPAYLPFDIAQVLLVACATAVLAAWWESRAGRIR